MRLAGTASKLAGSAALSTWWLDAADNLVRCPSVMSASAGEATVRYLLVVAMRVDVAACR